MKNFNEQINQTLDPSLPEGFLEAKNELLGKLKAEPSEEAVSAYAVRKEINLDAARARLQENYRKEVEAVEFKEVALRLSNAMKMISPKMMGLELREQDREHLVNQAVAKSNEALAKVNGAVREAREAVEDAKAEAHVFLVEEIKKLDLLAIARSITELQQENKELWLKLENLQKRKSFWAQVKAVFG